MISGLNTWVMITAQATADLIKAMIAGIAALFSAMLKIVFAAMARRRADGAAQAKHPARDDRVPDQLVATKRVPRERAPIPQPAPEPQQPAPALQIQPRAHDPGAQRCPPAAGGGAECRGIRH